MGRVALLHCRGFGFRHKTRPQQGSPSVLDVEPRAALLIATTGDLAYRRTTPGARLTPRVSKKSGAAAAMASRS